MPRVKVYRNLTRKQWSILDVRTRRVIGHLTSLVLTDVVWHVQPGGRQRVRDTGHKTVHAYAVGDIASIFHNVSHARQVPERQVRYNPREMDTFQLNGEPLHEADVVYFTEDGKVYV